MVLWFLVKTEKTAYSVFRDVAILWRLFFFFMNVLIISVSPKRSPPAARQGKPVGTKWTRRIESGHSLRPFLALDALPPALPRAPALPGRPHSTQRPFRPKFPLRPPFALQARMAGSPDVAPIALVTLKSDARQSHVAFDALRPRGAGWSWWPDDHGSAHRRRGRVCRSKRRPASADAAAVFAGASRKSHGPGWAEFAL